MKIVKKIEAIVHKNSDTCFATEYPSDDKDINIGIVKIEGRYPESGYALNEVCKELAYVSEGEGKIVFLNGEVFSIEEGDSVLIEPKEKYYWEGKFTLFVPCSPAWYPEQHKKIKD